MASARKQAEMAARRAGWKRIVEQAEASRLPIRQYCQRHDVDEGQFYHWRRRLELEAARSKAAAAVEPGFALVRTRPPANAAAPSEPEAGALELLLDRGWRLRIPPGVDEATLRAVLGALGAQA